MDDRVSHSPADIFRDECEPRPPPLFPLVPTPFDMDPPKPLVPELSLISPNLSRSFGIHNNGTSPNSANRPPNGILRKQQPSFNGTTDDYNTPVSRNRATNGYGQTRQQQCIPVDKSPPTAAARSTPSPPLPPPPPPEPNNDIVQELITLIKNQSMAIANMQLQLDELISSKNVCHCSCKSDIQKPIMDTTKKNSVTGHVLRPSLSCEIIEETREPQQLENTRKRNAPPKQYLETPSQDDKLLQRSKGGRLKAAQASESPTPHYMSQTPKDQIMPLWNDGRRKKSPPYYVMDTPEQPRTDSTIYGLSSKHLSFSTKQYLQRHGLVHSNSIEDSAVSPKVLQDITGSNSIIEDGSRSPSGRILDITAIRNQPKLA